MCFIVNLLINTYHNREHNRDNFQHLNNPGDGKTDYLNIKVNMRTV